MFTLEAMEAGRIVSELFCSPEALGSIRLREQVSFPKQADIRALLDVLQAFSPRFSPMMEAWIVAMGS